MTKEFMIVICFSRYHAEEYQVQLSGNITVPHMSTEEDLPVELPPWVTITIVLGILVLIYLDFSFSGRHGYLGHSQFPPASGGGGGEAAVALVEVVLRRFFRRRWQHSSLVGLKS